MDRKQQIIQQSIVRDMSEGVMTIGLDGIITSLNAAGSQILDRSAQELVGHSFARCFVEYPENDAFNQAVLDAVYDQKVSHRSIVPYFTGSEVRQLHVTTAYLRDGVQRIGVVAVLSDISELVELRDAVKAMERIKSLNIQLELRNQLITKTFGRYLSDQIVEEILNADGGLPMGGKKMPVTILMSDLRGFTALSERMEPHALTDMLNHYLSQMARIIEKRGGTVMEYLGDGILAVFGAPVFQADHAARSVAAALEMQQQMEAVNAWNARMGYPILEMGIGVNSGTPIVGNIGSEERTRYGVIGSEVNLCGRIESYTVGGQVLISLHTRAQIREELEISQEIEVAPKGVTKPITVSHVTAIGAPYSISCKIDAAEPQPLERPLKTDLYMIREKHADMSPRSCALTALCDTGAVMETAAPLHAFDNIKLSAAGGELFCKVMERRGAGWLVRFTAKPANFAQWLSAGGNRQPDRR